jgi:hypothetical protein
MQKTGSKKNKVILQTPVITKNLDKQLSPDSLYIIIFVIVMQRLSKLIYLYSNVTATVIAIFFFCFSFRHLLKVSKGVPKK